MKLRFCVVLLAMAAAACSGQTDSSSTSSTPASAQSAGAMSQPMAGHGDTITIKIKALNGSGESGTATLTRLASRTRVVIGIKGENTTGKQPAHIHKGTCAKLDPKPAYPLHDVVLGKSNTVVDASFDELVSTPMAINVTLHKQLPYDPAADFVPLVMVAGAPFVLVVNAALPVHSAKELIALAKTKSLTYGSGGPGAPHHLYASARPTP